jgi:Fis family transcriptional regulator
MMQAPKPLQIERRTTPLRTCVEEALSDYFETLDGHQPCDLYKLVMGEAEHALLSSVLRHTQGNQTRAAELLNINRGTLRKKLRLHGLEHGFYGR